VRRTALPSPGDERELGIVVSRLHGHAVDFHRPPWEAHLIEGLEGGRFAMYVKVHHALVDGFTAMRILIKALSHDANERDRPLFFSVPPPAARARGPGDDRHSLPELPPPCAQYGATKTIHARCSLSRAMRWSRASGTKCVLNGGSAAVSDSRRRSCHSPLGDR
jgi:hypothetical protein